MRSRPLTAFPTLGPAALTASIEAPFPPLGHDAGSVSFLSSARAAVYHATKKLGIRKAFVPSYNCGVEIEAILRAGAALEYYPVRRDMRATLDGVLDRDHEPGSALFLVHYWGFPQKVDEIARQCRERGLLLIEDCAHAMFSELGGRPLGGFGDAAVYSLPKSLPVPDGGLLLGRAWNSPIGGLRRANHLVATKAALRSVLNHARADRVAGLARMATAMLALKQRVAADENGGLGDYGETPLTTYDRKMSPIARHVLRRSSSDRIRPQRRRNYERLAVRLARVEGVDLIFDRLVEGVSPLFCPVVVDDRDGLERHLDSQHIRPFVFGRHLHSSLDGETYPDALFLSRHVLGLPVHQGLREPDMDRIADEVLVCSGR